MDIKIKLDMFEGPLDLLLHLIEKAEVDIYEISIAKITSQYMQVLAEAKELQLEIASEFLVMAATLLAIKSRMLLPKQEILEDEQLIEEDEWIVDPREELIERLLEYKRYKRLGELLREREEARSKVYTRPPMDLTPYAPDPNPVEGLTVDDLLQAFVDVLKTHKQSEPMTKVAREEISVSARMDEIYQQLLREGKLIFSKLLRWSEITKERVITTFLALLELMKLKKIICYQDQLFGEIFIEQLEGKGSEA
ncbi:segregation and condensation protein A [Thermoflavimicrobium dichotomicum]|uniref:Segregation and condensation protein A n=1 Tax=Thermoflavimicrobium dichotomicum TaxID=46223 RepID=A0A1I3V4L7_9BACL|nr:segregation/condensation protein A [Thermoflavimicrobium dichotomicum]SFJ90070.1 condensin subunit ScpA [Thermoflavimicrobium dichotomicum]